jgi:hypothetical protein
MKSHNRLFLPLIFSVLTFCYRGELIGTVVRRGSVILTLGMILWIIYRLFEENVIVFKKILLVALIGVVSLLFIFASIFLMGW